MVQHSWGDSATGAIMLFRDPLGHATQPTMDVVTYLWFAALYHQPLDGLTTLVEAGDPTSPARQAVLQRIASG